MHVNPDGVVVWLTGWTALAALKREGRVLMRATWSISTGRHGAAGLRIAGTAIPWTDIRAGRSTARCRVPRTTPWEWTTRIRSRSDRRVARRLVTQWRRTVSGAIRRITRSDVIAESS